MAEMLERLDQVRKRATELQQALAAGNTARIDAAVENLASASDPLPPGASLNVRDENQDPLVHAQAETAVADTLFAAANSVSAADSPELATNLSSEPSISDALSSLDNAAEALRSTPPTPRASLEQVPPSDAASVRLAAEDVLKTVVDQEIDLAVSIPASIVSAGLGDKAKEARDRLLGGALKLPGVGWVIRLIGKGLEAAKRAAVKVLELLPDPARKQVDALVAKFEAMLATSAKQGVADRIFETGGARSHVDQRLAGFATASAALGTAKSDLETLNETAKQRLGFIMSAASNIGKYGKYAKLLPIANNTLFAAELALFGLIVGAAVYLGRDYTDADTTLQFVPGVRVIVDRIV